jgi:hypothetical protein
MQESSMKALLATCFYAGFLLCLFFDPEDRGDMFLWNVSWFERTTRHYIPEDRTLRNKNCLIKSSFCRIIYRNPYLYYLSSPNMITCPCRVCFVRYKVSYLTSDMMITHPIFLHSYTCCRKKIKKVTYFWWMPICVLICCYHMITPTVSNKYICLSI